MAERLPDGRFAPGKSGNPGGAPKGLAEVRELARKHTKEAISDLAAMARSKKTPPAARVAAWREVMDRAWGKSTQAVEVSGAGGGPVRVEALEGLTDEQLEELERTIATASAAGGVSSDG